MSETSYNFLCDDTVSQEARFEGLGDKTVEIIKGLEGAAKRAGTEKEKNDIQLTISLYLMSLIRMEYEALEMRRTLEAEEDEHERRRQLEENERKLKEKEEERMRELRMADTKEEERRCRRMTAEEEMRMWRGYRGRQEVYGVWVVWAHGPSL
jgi:hypothetical protein